MATGSEIFIENQINNNMVFCNLCGKSFRYKEVREIWEYIKDSINLRIETIDVEAEDAMLCLGCIFQETKYLFKENWETKECYSNFSTEGFFCTDWFFEALELCFYNEELIIFNFNSDYEGVIADISNTNYCLGQRIKSLIKETFFDDIGLGYCDVFFKTLSINYKKGEKCKPYPIFYNWHNTKGRFSISENEDRLPEEALLNCRGRLTRSPIEGLFFDAWLEDQNLIGLTPQYPIGNYYADFAEQSSRTVIELDGHDFHKTKEQRSNDYKRERFLMKEGWQVVRFTGSEIYNDVTSCVKEAKEIIRTKRKKINDES